MEGTRKHRNYVSLREGMMTRRAIVGDDPDYIKTVELKNGNHVDEIHFNYMEGRAESIYITTRKIKDQGVDYLCVDMNVNNQSRTLQVSLVSSAAMDILARWENINHNAVFTINSGRDDKRNFLWITQHGQKILKKYTKDTPNGLPPWRKVMKDGAEQWDRTEAIGFWKGKILEFDAELRKVQPPAHEKEFMEGGPTSSDQWQ